MRAIQTIHVWFPNWTISLREDLQVWSLLSLLTSAVQNLFPYFYQICTSLSRSRFDYVVLLYWMFIRYGISTLFILFGLYFVHGVTWLFAAFIVQVCMVRSLHNCRVVSIFFSIHASHGRPPRQFLDVWPTPVRSVTHYNCQICCSCDLLLGFCKRCVVLTEGSHDGQISLDTFSGGQLHTLLTSTSSLVDPMFMMKHFMVSPRMVTFTQGI